ncbi:putative uncharacterized protein [Parachlamydia acanthamoebae UV-7]|uniref:Uncharacterized protein n=1 Tax=Parachlamydia acanthamoebae (strain UV7) TaxID=765952 RepID=F8L1S2_PARAV|nr:hypothetical protein pah_c200o091 [Parachlamydia acanthamoebae str. Hall's coccus]CCB87231.1 putative uncharacterized protein [Parachlamydia acanthamoebae UV-7]
MIHIADKNGYTRRLLGGLHPLCGQGVTSRIEVINNPAPCKPRTADSRPAPGPFNLTSTSRIPTDIANFAASCAATVAANAEDLREPEKLTFPALAHETTFPFGSVMDTIVLLKVALTCATPDGTCACNFFLGFAAAAFLFTTCLDKVIHSSLIFSY